MALRIIQVVQDGNGLNFPYCDCCDRCNKNQRKVCLLSLDNWQSETHRDNYILRWWHRWLRVALGPTYVYMYMFVRSALS